MHCLQCGTCCTAPDIKTLGKGLGERCRNLGDDNCCLIYDDRPDVCRGYQPDELCRQVAAPTLDERVEKYLRLFGFNVMN